LTDVNLWDGGRRPATRCRDGRATIGELRATGVPHFAIERDL
jgi:hypothetical protein